MSPAITGRRAFDPLRLSDRNNPTFGDWRFDNTAEGFIVEAWGEGFVFGALLVMSLTTLVNMRRKVLLHKLILLEVLVYPSRRRVPTNYW